MERTVTTQVRLFLKPGANPPPVDVYLPLLFNSKRGSYHVPVHIRQNGIDPFVDIQYGAKGYPEGVLQLWQDCRDYFDAIWVRYFDESTEQDMIFTVSDYGKSEDNVCRYTFDHLRITWQEDNTPSIQIAERTGLAWKVRGNVWGINVTGTYLAANFRGDICHTEPRLRPGIGTQTTSACLMGGGIDWMFFDFYPKEVANFVFHHREDLEKVELYHKRRLVRVEVLHPEDTRWGWTFFCLDDWDNCVDYDYHVYLKDYTQRRKSR